MGCPEKLVLTWEIDLKMYFGHNGDLTVYVLAAGNWNSIVKQFENAL